MSFSRCNTLLTNQIFHYSRYNTLKRVISLRGPSPRHRGPGNTEMSQQWRAVGNTVSDLTGPRFKP